VSVKKNSAGLTKKKRSPPAHGPPAHGRPFPIVGLGASAGGLEALELFLKHVPAGCGIAFVIVQHLDPTYKGMIVELLQRGTAMPVLQVNDGMNVEPDHVYVIPPGRDLSIVHGVLHLCEPSAPRGLRLPIDFFFRSLADDRRDRGIAVILSGMGSDGKLGLRAIKETAGAVFVQTPATAKFDGMPRSAIEDGLADVVAPAEELPGKIVAYLRNPRLIAHPELELAEKDQSELEKIIVLLRAQTSHDFSLYKKSTLYRRIELRMGLHQLARIKDYVRYLRENPQESDLLFKDLLIGVTSFFRDHVIWAELKAETIPSLLKARPNGGELRFWTPGCSTGEEAYSLAMVFKEVMDKVNPAKNVSLQIFATDLDKEAIDQARRGVYPANIVADVSEERLRRFFVEDEQGYRISKDIREMVIFATQNLVMNPPFTKIDLLSCRNLLIYLELDLQKKLLPLFHYSLNPGGILMLGSAESIGTDTDLFAPLSANSRLFRRLESPLRREFSDFPAGFAGSRTNAAEARAPLAMALPSASLQSLADQLLLQRYSPAAALVTDQGDILYISGKTGKYLEPTTGKANWNLIVMAREGLSFALEEAFHKAVRQKVTITLKGVKVGTNGGTQAVDVTIQPLSNPVALRGLVMVVFTDIAAPPGTETPSKSERAAVRNTRLAALTRELREAHDALRDVREDRQTSQEELKSSYEELQSTNEELQSSNEELTTSKEEMQSMNEELQTVNSELRAKFEELSRANSDMMNLLNSTGIATMFLDEALRVRRFTRQTTSIIKLIPSDAGRPITDIVTELDYPTLAEDVREVLRTLIFIEKDVSARDGRWFTVRIIPYRTQDNRIDGVVITFFDISIAKKLEAALRKAQSELEGRMTLQTAELAKTNECLQGEIDHRIGRKLAERRTPGSDETPKEAR
jgi:two-component system, chemotaxis family, CheB/CheR fusion protein